MSLGSHLLDHCAFLLTHPPHPDQALIQITVISSVHPKVIYEVKSCVEKNEMGRAWRITLVWKILAIGSPAKPDVNLPWSSRRRQLFRLLATFIFLVRSLSKSGSRLSLPEKRYDCDLLKRTIQVENHFSTHGTCEDMSV